jgi:hypothetical protein
MERLAQLGQQEQVVQQLPEGQLGLVQLVQEQEQVAQLVQLVVQLEAQLEPAQPVQQLHR